jgi:hypothetical protein
MSRENKKVEKDVKCVVTNEVWKKLKILSVMKEISLPELVTQVLESFVAKKKFDSEESPASV